MIEAGVFAEEERIELLDGTIVPMSPTSPRHAAHVARLGDLLRSLLGTRAQVREEKAIALEPTAQPEPDVAVVRVREDFYAVSHPAPADIYFLVEAADTSLERDRGVKLAIYASGGISVVWVLDLVGDRLWVASGPRDREYAQVGAYGRPDGETRVAIPGFPDLSVRIGDILGPPPRSRQR
jgi:Uma2 family endonuclease